MAEHRIKGVNSCILQYADQVMPMSILGVYYQCKDKAMVTLS